MSTDIHRAALARQLAVNGWSSPAIATALHVSVEQVSRLAAEGQEPAFRTATVFGTTTRASVAGNADMTEQARTTTRTRATRGARTAEDFGRATFERLAKQRARLQAEGALLRAEIERLAQTDPGPARGRAKRIQPQLSRPVSLRQVQRYLTVIYDASSACRERVTQADLHGHVNTADSACQRPEARLLDQ